MNRKVTQLLFPLLFMWLFIACAQDDPAGNEPAYESNGGDIRFEIGFVKERQNLSDTRVVTDSDFNSIWEEGDLIGLFAVNRLSGEVKGLAASGNYIHNVKLTYTGGGWISSEELWFPSEGVLDFYAYYPYNDNNGNPDKMDPTNMKFKVEQDQSIASNHHQSDLLTAKANNNGDGYRIGETVELQFAHALSLVQVTIPVEGRGYGPDESLTVKLRGIQPATVLNLATGTVVEESETVSITMYRMEQPGDVNYDKTYTYRALVPAQTLEANQRLFWFENKIGQQFMDGVSGVSIDLKAGYAEKFTRTLPANSLHTVRIPAGEFLMGSPVDEPSRWSYETQHRVRLTQDFYMSKYPVTHDQYAYFLNSIGIGSDGILGGYYYVFEGQGFIWDRLENKWIPSEGYADHPVRTANWYAAAEYARWIGGSLPTEAQWEYACRGDKGELPFGIGDGKYMDSTMANINGNYIYDYDNGGQQEDPNGIYLETTTPVGSYAPNSYGLYDMHGNVDEWCADWYDINYGLTDAQLGDIVVDPMGPLTGTKRTYRGGNSSYEPRSCRSGCRGYVEPLYPAVGIRVVFTP